MLAGRIAAYDALEIFASAAASYSLSDAENGVQFAASLVTGWCPSPTERDPFIEILWSGSVAPTTGVVTGSLAVTIPPLGIGPITVIGAALVAASAVTITLADLRIYQRTEAWYATWSGLTVLIDATPHAFGAGSIVGPRLTPTGLPFLGIPATLATSIAPSAAQVAGPITGGVSPTSHSYSGSSSCSGGYRLKEVGAGALVALPVRLDVLLGSTTGCPCEPTLLPTITAPDSGSGSVTAGFTQTRTCVYRGRFSCATCPDGQAALIPAQFDVYDTTAEQQDCRSSVTLVPNLPKSVKRFGPDYAALIFRGGLPGTTAYTSDTCFDFVSDVTTGSVSQQTNPNPRESSFLATVGNAPHVIEAPLTVATLAPYGWSADHLLSQATASVLVHPGACPDTGEGGGGSPIPCFPVLDVACLGSRISTFPASVDDLSANPELTPGLYHSDPLARFIDSWSAPHWNYAYWFPPDVPEGGLLPFEWPLDNARANPSDYWLPAKTQWHWNPALPGGEATRKRADLVSAPLANGGLAGAWRSFFAPLPSNLVSPWGICRFQAQGVSPPSTITLTPSQTAIWSFTGASATFDVGAITLTPSGSSCLAKLALGSFANDPYQILALFLAVSLNWSGDGIASVSATLVGVDGSTVALATAPGVYPWPLGAQDVKYAGSWGQDFGVGFTASDVGVDSIGSGSSAAELANGENCFALQLPFGFGAASLDVAFTLSDPTPAVTLEYPTFSFYGGAPTVVQETAFTAAILTPLGPGVRFGAWNWWTTAWQNPPAVRPFGKVSTVLDWLAWKRVVLAPSAPDSGLDTELSGLYDAVELSVRGDAAAGTHSFLVCADGRLTGVLVNSLAETPPLAVFPVRARDSALAPTGDFALEAWSHAKGPRDIVSAQAPADLFDPEGVQWTSPTAAPPGWTVSRYDRAVTNSEDSTFTVRSGGVTYAQVSPWHGYFCVLFPGAGAEPWVVQSRFGELHLAWIEAGDIRYRWSPVSTPAWLVTARVTTDGGWSNPRMCLDHRGRIELRAIQSDAAFRFVSDDNGRTWSAGEAL